MPQKGLVIRSQCAWIATAVPTACPAIKSRGSHRLVRRGDQRARFEGEINEDPLGNFARQVRRADARLRRRP